MATCTYAANNSSRCTFGDSTSILDKWYHLATQIKGTTGRIYVNGKETASNEGMVPPANVFRSTCDIASMNLDAVSVAMDELKFYNRALTPEEIRMDFELNGPIV
jgi:hypothetical protein